MIGKIARKVKDKGFGFIESTEDGKDYFFHHTGCDYPFDSLQEGNVVEFQIEKNPKGPRANHVKPING